MKGLFRALMVMVLLGGTMPHGIEWLGSGEGQASDGLPADGVFRGSGAARVWDFAPLAGGSGLATPLPESPERLEIWDLWEPESRLEVWDFGGHPQAPGRPDAVDPIRVPLPDPSEILHAREVVNSGGSADLRSLAMPPDTLEIWDLWEPERSLEVWDFGGHPQAPGRPDAVGPIRVPLPDPSEILHAREVVNSGGSADLRSLAMPPDTLEIWDLWEPGRL